MRIRRGSDPLTRRRSRWNSASASDRCLTRWERVSQAPLYPWTLPNPLAVRGAVPGSKTAREGARRLRSRGREAICSHSGGPPAGVTLRQTITLYAQAVLCLELPPKFRTRLLGTRRRRDLPIKPISPRKLLVLNRARFATSIQHGAQKSYAFGICVQSLGI